MDITFDPQKLTIGDLETIEEITGEAYGHLNWQDPNAKLLMAIVYLNGKRDDPAFTLDDARSVPVISLTVADSPNPTADAGAS